MGLDMYLTRKKFVGANYEHRKVKGLISISTDGKEIPIDFNKVSYIEESVGYWRKANAIHNWFVENVQNGEDDCKTYYVSITELEELLELCKEVKRKAILKEGKIKNGEKLENGEWVSIMEDGKYIENAEEIEELLPTTSGCFFGSTDYDEYYMYDINKTIEMLEELIEEDKEYRKIGLYCDYIYQSSW